MNTYRLRPCYGSSELLIEFIHGPENNSFFRELKNALQSLAIEITATEDLWMNDEVLLTLSSSAGTFTFSKDIWNFAFIMANDNQECILKIDALLSKHALFIKQEVNFNDYK